MARIRETTVIEKSTPDDEIHLKGESGSDVQEKVSTGPDSVSSIPLFPDIQPEDISNVRYIEVHRLVPADGFLAEVDPSTSLTEVTERFGGKRLLLKAISNAGHKYIKQRTVDVGYPPKKPTLEEDVSKNGRGRDEDISEALLDGLLDVKNSVRDSQRVDPTQSLIALAITRSQTEGEIAKSNIENTKAQLEVERERIKEEIALKQKQIESELDFRKKEIDARLESEKQRMEIEKMKMENDRKQYELERKDREDRLEKELKEDRIRRKEEMEQFKREQDEKEKRERAFLSATQEREQKFQTLMLTLSKGNDSVERMMQVLQMGMDMASEKGDGEENDPMMKIVGKIPDVIDMVVGVRQNRALATVQGSAIPALPNSNQPIEVYNGPSRRGRGRNMPQAPTADKPPVQNKQPGWVPFLSFALRNFSVDLIGDAVLELSDSNTLNAQAMGLIMNTPEPQAKLFLQSKNPAFVQPNVWAKIKAIRAYIASELARSEAEDEEPAPDTGDFGFESSSGGETAPAESVVGEMEPAKE